ncbi:MAG: hypothetical protein ABMA26_14130 [Limisphaerales bacterium]
MNPPETPAPQTNPPKPEWFSRLVFWLLSLNVILLLAAASAAPFSLTDFQGKLVMAGLLGEVVLVPAVCCWHRRWGWAVAFVVVGLLSAIALPNFVKARETRSKNACPATLKVIDDAVRKWARNHKKTATDTYSLSDPQILRHLRGSVLPVCPAGGRYSPGTNVSDGPKCSFAAWGHTL